MRQKTLTETLIYSFGVDTIAESSKYFVIRTLKLVKKYTI